MINLFLTYINEPPRIEASKPRVEIVYHFRDAAEKACLFLKRVEVAVVPKKLVQLAIVTITEWYHPKCDEMIWACNFWGHCHWSADGGRISGITNKHLHPEFPIKARHWNRIFFNVSQFWDISRCTMFFRPTKKVYIMSISGVSFSVVFIRCQP